VGENAMGDYTCEVTGKCVTGEIASTGIHTLHRTLETFRKAGENRAEISITVKGSETVSFSFEVDDITEVLEILRLAAGE
jgi:hypothetical protein